MKPSSFAPIPVSKLSLTSLNKNNPAPVQHSNQISGNKPILPPPPPPLPPTQTGPLSNAINKVISNGTSKPPMPIRAPAPTTPAPTATSTPVAPPAAAGGATTVSIQAYFADLSRAKTEINAVYHDIATKEKDLLNLRIEGQHEFDAAQKKSINELNKEYTELIKHSKELNSAIVKNTQVMEGYNSMMIKNTQTLEEVANHLLTLKNSVGVVAQHQPSPPPPPNSPVPPQQKTRGRKAATEPKPSKRQRKNKNKITSDDETEDPAAAGAVPEENKGSDDQQQHQQVDSHDGLFVTNSNLTLEDLANAEGNGVVEEGNSGGEQVDSDGRSLGSQLAF